MNQIKRDENEWIRLKVSNVTLFKNINNLKWVE